MNERYNHHKFGRPDLGELSSDLLVDLSKSVPDRLNEVVAFLRRVLREALEVLKRKRCGRQRQLWFVPW